MAHLHTFRTWIGVVTALTMVALPGCASLESKEDSQVVGLRRDLSLIGDWSASNQEKIQEIYDQVRALEAEVKGLKSTLSKITGGSRSRVARGTQTTPAKMKAAPTKVATAPRSKRRAPKPKVKKTSAPATPSPQREYEKAHIAYNKHRYDEALAMFKSFYQRYPDHELADNAQYWLGEIYYDREDYPNAILAFKEVVTRHVEENKAPDALLKIGYAYIALDDPANARVFLKRVIKNYPFGESEAKARAKLKEIENL